MELNIHLNTDIDLPDSKLDTIIAVLMATYAKISAQVIQQVAVGFALDVANMPAMPPSGN